MDGDSPGHESLRRVAPYALTAVAVAAASWLEVLIIGSGATQLSLTPLALAVAVSVWLGGLPAGLLALVLSAFAMDFFVVEPGSLLRFRTPGSAVTYAAFLAGWLVFCVLVDSVQRRMRADGILRKAAEHAAWQADRIAQLTSALAQARTPSTAIESALQEPIHALGADAAIMLLTSSDGKQADVARAIGYPSVRDWPPVMLSEKSPASDAAGRGAPVFIASRRARAAEYFDLAPETGGITVEATIAVPLMIGSRVAALAQFDFIKPRPISDADRDYLEVFSTRAAQALDRTWQYEYALRARAEAETHRARADQEIAEREKIEVALRASEARGRALAARTSRLHGLTAALSESVTLAAVGKAVVRQGRVAVGATAGEVTLLVDDGTAFETLHADGEGMSAGSRYPVEPGFCATDAVRQGHAIYISSFEEWQERYPPSASRAADGGYVSSAWVPLLVDRYPIGVIAFYFTAPVNFDDEYRALLVSVAQDCAQALDRARLYEWAQKARAEAESANRLKDEFVSIVSHELRAPLNAILGWTAMLRTDSIDSSLATRALQSVHDNATRQARLIDELLDFSRVSSGRVALEREDIEICELLRGVVESLIPESVAKGVILNFPLASSARVNGDRNRLEQVFFNLLGNALKFTPQSGHITVELQEHPEEIEVRVTDSGMGIESEFLPFVFDRFKQGDNAAAREYGGLGLGLSIARQLVEAHDGRIRVESQGKGQGATFTVWLPLSRT
ncbi:MAG: GAF domain-containing protein [Acidobacteria bacterium]|nr:GAF domain-containing protein [Acidobacteriota bacterium]